MSYSSKLRIEIPASIYEISCNIARSLDPDTGGSESFGAKEQGDPLGVPELYSTETPCTPEFAGQALFMSKNPELLHSVVSTDYASRWNDLMSPTLDDCRLFCELAVISEITNS